MRWRYPLTNGHDWWGNRPGHEILLEGVCWSTRYTPFTWLEWWLDPLSFWCSRPGHTDEACKASFLGGYILTWFWLVKKKKIRSTNFQSNRFNTIVNTKFYSNIVKQFSALEQVKDAIRALQTSKMEFNKNS